MFYLTEQDGVLRITNKTPAAGIHIEAMSTNFAELVEEMHHCLACAEESFCEICDENHYSESLRDFFTA